MINLYKPLIDKEIVWVTDTSKWGFIPHVSLTILALSLTILRKQWSKKASLNLEACFMNRWSRLHWLLKQASFANEVSFISSWFEAQIKFTWASIKVYLSLTPNPDEDQFDLNTGFLRNALNFLKNNLAVIKKKCIFAASSWGEWSLLEDEWTQRAEWPHVTAASAKSAARHDRIINRIINRIDHLIIIWWKAAGRKMPALGFCCNLEF